MGHGRPTLAQVAALAGVSPATASKALNGHADVAAATRARVLRAVDESGYRARVDQRLTQQPPSVVAVLTGIETMYSATVLHGIVEGGAALGAEVVVRFSSRRSPGSLPKIGPLPANCVGVLVVTAAAQIVRAAKSEPLAVPVVAIDPWEAMPSDVITIGSTNWAGAKSATEHLLSVGHRDVGWIGGNTSAQASTERLQGYRAALHEAGLPLQPAFERNGSFTVNFGREATKDLLTGSRRPTALVAANDEIAIGALHAARALGLSIPDDLSVTGFDDTPEAQWCTPQLTSVRQPLTDMGRVAISTVLAAANGNIPDSRHIQLVTKLMLRQSTAAPHSRHATL